MNFRSKDCLIKSILLLVAFLTFTSTQAAKLYFNDIYKATGSSYTIQPSSLNGISSISGSGFKFTSANPADVSFSGNNIAGILTYTNSSNQLVSLYGVISRQNKANGKTMAVNFMPTDNTYANVTGEGYILVIPTKESSFTNGVNVGTSSDPIAAVLNDVLDTQNSSPIISVNDVTVNNTDSYAVFTISLSRAADAITTFTPSLSQVTATLNTDYTNSMQYYNGSTWVNITTVSIAQNATSIQIRVPILNAGAVSSKTFNLNTGSVTGSNILNSDGSYGIGTILPSPSITVSGNFNTFTSCTSIPSASQFFTISGSNLTSDLIVGSLSGYEYSLSSAGNYQTSLTLTPNTGSVNSTNIYVRLSSSATNAAGGSISISSSGATSKSIATGNAIVNSLQFTSNPILTVKAREQYLYSINASTSSNNSITFSDPTNSIPSWLSLSSTAQTNGQEIGDDIPNPGAVTGDLNGNIYVIQNSGNNIYKITPDGTTSVFATKSSNGYTYGGALVIGHYLYITFYNGAYGMAQYDLNSPNPVGVNMLPNISMLSMTYFNGFVYGAGYNTGKIFKISINESNPSSSTSSDYITSGLTGPFGLAFNQNGELFVAQYGGRNLLKYASNSTSNPSTIFTSTYSLTDTKIDNSGNVYVSFWGGNRIRKYAPDFTSFTDVSGINTTYVWGMSLNSNGTLFYGDNTGNKVFTLQTNANLSGNPLTAQVGQWPISLNANDQNCQITQNFTITVLPNVPMPVTDQTATAGNAAATITFTPPVDNGGATVTSYTVMSTVGNFSATSTGSPITISGLTNGTNYTFKIYATNSVGNSTLVTTTTVTPFAPPSITTSGTLNAFSSCLGTASAAQTFTVTAQDLISNLVLTAPAGYELSTSSGGTFSTTLSIVPTSGSISARLIYVRLSASSVNGQSGNITISSTDAVTKNIATGIASVTRTVAASVTISSSATNNTICASTNVTFTATPTNGGTTPTYQWKLNGNNITGANSATYSTTTLTSNDVITVLMGSSLTSCVTGTPATSNSITTTVTSIPATPGVVSGLTTICLNSNQVYSVASVTGATSYTWVVNGNISSTVSSTTNVINITAANTDGSGSLEVYANNACGTSVGSATLSITVNNTPAPTAGFSTSSIAGVVCLSTPTVTFTNTSTPNSGSTLTAYNWDFGDGSTQITTANASRTYTSSGIYDVVMAVTSSNNCTSSFSSRIIVDPTSVAGTATAANSTICEGSNTVLSLTGNTGKIQWQQSSDNIIFTDISGATSVTYNTGNLTATTYYRAVVTSGSCSSATSGVVTVTVSPTPSVTLGQVANVYANATTFSLTYNNTIGSPDEYSISSVAPNAMPNFNTVNNFGLLSSPITVTIPQSSIGTYNFNLSVKNGAFGCSSADIPFTLTVAVTPPSNLVYNSPNVYLTGSPITALNPSNDGGVITNYSIGPSLPAGLTIDPTTGVISGTPTATSPQTTYTVTGTNASGTVTSTVVITVNVAPPASLSYNTPNVYTDGTSITALNPNSTGGPIVQYTISPNLSSGLTINSSTGIISGTPSGTAAQTTYVVTGTNASGTISATVVITVNGAVTAPVVQSQTEYCEQAQVSEYKYAKVVFSNTKNLSSANSIQVAEWKWFDGNTEISRTNVTVTNPGGSNPSGEAPSNIYDGSNSTKWLDFNIKTGNNTSTLIFAFPGSGARISSYYWVTANDSEERDPKSWTVYMSNDNVNWTEVHTVSNYTAPSSRFTATNSWSFANASSPVTLSATAVSGYSLRWYTAASGGTPSTTAPTLNTSVVGSATYYVSQINQAGYETPRSVLTVNVNALPAAPVVSNVNYTAGATATQLTATNLSNHTLQWYTVSSGGTSSTTAPTPSTNSVGTVNYYVSQVNDVTGCESPRGTIVVTTSVAAPASLSYTSPNIYTTGTTITALTPISTGGTISNYTISPSLPAGLTLNTSTGIISGNPSAVKAQTTYIVTGTNASGTVTATVVLTVNTNAIPQPQASVNALDYGLLATDTVNLKMSITNGIAPFTLILNNSVNSTKDTITDLTPVNNEVRFKLKRLDTTKVFTIFKLIDANNNTRTSGFTKDTTIVNVLKPKILLTLKAEPTIKQADNSFKTRLLLKVKNSGDLDLRNVQVNANLSSVFPTGINYVLDSVRVLAGNFALNPNYTGAGSATSASSTQFTATASANGSKQSFATLDQNYLFNNGVSLNKDEEGEVVYFVSIGATTQNVTLKLQFESAGDGVLVKNDGTSSAQETTSASDDGTNIDQHPDLTNNGLPSPTFVPLFPNEKVGASLSVSSSTPVTGGYEFHFVAKIKNYGNVNLDSIRIEYDLNKMYPSSDQAVLISNPTITRGNIVYNAATFDGVNDINLFDYGGKLEVGDSATYEYDLKVTTSRTTYTWPNYFIVYARSINSGLIVNDTSMAGSNPDPNNDNDPLERFFTNVTISYQVPAPPVVENKIYVFGTTIPANIGGLVKSTPTGTIPVWCNEKTAACSVTPPSTPTEIGRYIFALRSYDTATLLYSDVLVYDTIIIKPPVPLVVNKKYIIGNTANPNNVSGQVTGLVNSTLKYFRNATLQTSIPTLGNTAGVTRYTTSQTVNSIESDTVGFTVTMLDPTSLLHLQKIASEPRLLPNATFNITYTFLVRNRSEESMTNILVADNLQNTFPSPTLFDVTSVSSTGGLVFNNAFNGKTDIQLLRSNSVLAANSTDTIRLTLNLQPKGYTGTVNNVAVITATTPYGSFSMNSSSTGFANETVKTPTPLTIPDLKIDIPEAFSPNRDGVNDRFIIVKPFGTTLELEVYNRWGNVVYYNANYNNEWDGRGTNNFIGQDLMDGGYYYTLKTKSANGNSQIFKGFVLIQR